MTFKGTMVEPHIYRPQSLSINKSQTFSLQTGNSIRAFFCTRYALFLSSLHIDHWSLILQPLEIGKIQARLKGGGLSIGKEKLADILDFMVTS